jgi:hypothetical protein
VKANKLGQFRSAGILLLDDAQNRPQSVVEHLSQSVSAAKPEGGSAPRKVRVAKTEIFNHSRLSEGHV